jgi:hypothetical protein
MRKNDPINQCKLRKRISEREYTCHTMLGTVCVLTLILGSHYVTLLLMA